MDNDEQVEKLVEWVAETMYYQNVSTGFKWENEGQWFRDKYLNHAKAILFDPDHPLALIVRPGVKEGDNYNDPTESQYQVVPLIPFEDHTLDDAEEEHKRDRGDRSGTSSEV